MSSKNRAGAGTSVPLDQYDTPAAYCNVVVDLVNAGAESILDPCCGKGNVLAAFDNGSPRALLGVEIDANAGNIARARGFEVQIWDALLATWPEAEVIVTNPPYELAEQFLRKSIKHSKEVAMLLRVGFLGSKKREPLFKEIGMPEVHILSPRPNFVKVGKCALGCGWRQVFAIEDKNLPQCPRCERDGFFAKVKYTTSDSSEYAWMIWGSGHTNTIHRIEVT